MHIQFYRAVRDSIIKIYLLFAWYCILKNLPDEPGEKLSCLFIFVKGKAMNLMHTEFMITGNVPEEILVSETGILS